MDPLETLEMDRETARRAAEGDVEAQREVESLNSIYHVGATPEQAAENLIRHFDEEISIQREMNLRSFREYGLLSEESEASSGEERSETSLNEERSSDSTEQNSNNLKRKNESTQNNETDVEEEPKKKRTKYDDDDNNSKGGPSGTTGPPAGGGPNSEPPVSSDSHTNLKDSIFSSFYLFIFSSIEPIFTVLENLSLLS